MKKHLRSDSKVFPFLSLIVLAVIWGSSFILMKRGLEAYSPIQVGALRVVLSALVLLPVAWKHHHQFLRKYWKHFLFFACVTNLLPAILFAQAQSQISSSLAGILNSMTPIFTFGIGIIFFASPFKVNQAAGLIMGIAGSVMLILFSGGGLGNINYYALFVVLATMFYGMGNNFLRKHFMGIPPVALTAVSFLTVLPVAFTILVLAGFFGTVTTHPLAMQSLGYIFILAIVGTAMSLILFNKLIQTTSAVFASTVTYLIPIVAVAWGLLDGETISIMHIGGLILIISGIWFVSKG
ncbi:MAG: DMT family transporter [Ignavibacteria bacterium]|nr:DMT family transporter [Ignavibacteria bacterium]